MATGIALPPFSALHADLVTSRVPSSATMEGLEESEIENRLMCGFEHRLVRVKTEPILEECMDSFCNNTYTELTSATLSQIKQGHTDMYGGSTADRDQPFSSWTYTHPEHWESRELLDWLFSLADAENFDGALFRGEAYNTLTGKQLCNMTLEEFVALDSHYGFRVYEVFQMLLRDADFKKPVVKCETGGNVPDFACLECPVNDLPPARTPTSTPTRTPAHSPSPPPPTEKDQRSKMSIVVNLPGLGQYDIDISVKGSQCADFDSFNDMHVFTELEDSDYSSGSDAEASHHHHHNRSTSSVSSDIFEPMFSDDENSSDIAIPDLTRNTHTPSASSDSGNESDDRRTSRTRRPPSTSKGNHLWEFVRDLLKDTRFNPTLVKWEDREMGVFKFVQSEAVAQMWGRKKNNPGMTYEKLSRAMRFCRSAGYFANVPRTGRFPKKLCFKFGPKAHDWLD